jgi:hypothetical protein
LRLRQKFFRSSKKQQKPVKRLWIKQKA